LGCRVAVSPVQEIIRFGLFELDLAAGQLTRQGVKLRLPQQPLQLLAMLLERPGEILTRDELRQRLWPADVFVDFDHGLNKSIQKLREALGDSAGSPRYIETIPRVGYRFIAPVSQGNKFPPATMEPAPALPVSGPSTEAPSFQPRWWMWMLAMAAVAVCSLAFVYLSSRTHPAAARFVKLTDFTDSASGPALSSDGKMLAFFRGGSSFVSADAVYVKMLPNGEPRRLTDDARYKYALAFSPDDSQIAYTVMQDQGFSTVIISTLGGDPHLMLNNAAALTWLDTDHVLFSRIRSGLHLGVVSATVTGDHLRELYYPAHERSMDHYSFASPDRTSVLVVEMGTDGAWEKCRLISLAAGSPSRQVGPEGGCSAAGWSPDGAWMYFIADVDGQSHLWRQSFPYGQPQQITFGPTEEDGLAVERDGHSVITAMGVHESAIWLHDAHGERSLSSEGQILNYPPPVFTPGDQFLYFLTLHQATDSGPELWRLSLATGTSEPVLPGIHMAAFDISPDGKQVVYSTEGRGGNFQLWIAPADRSAPPRQIGTGNERWPHFGPDGEIVFLAIEGNTNYLERMTPDGLGRSKVIPLPIHELQSVSPGRNWLVAVVIRPEGKTAIPSVMAIPLQGGEPRRLCRSYCVAVWASSGKYLYLPVEASTQTSPGRSLAIPLGAAEALPALPADGIRPFSDASVMPGAQSVNRAELVGGKDPANYAYVNTTVHSNLYRVSLP
jgi:DNA-binding winged helix-turn-helix (wHTH) protein/Tol biopolymer transport system component